MSRIERMGKFTILSLIGLVSATALGMAAMRDASLLAASVVGGVTLLLLFFAALGALVLPGPAGSWRGFTLFGWGCFLLNLLTVESTIIHPSTMPTESLIALIVDRVHPSVIEPARPDFALKTTVMSSGGWPQRRVIVGNLTEYEPLTVEERAVWDDYTKRLEDYQAQKRVAAEKLPHARKVGRSIFTIAFACIGAIAGKALVIRHRKDGSSLQPNQERA